MRSQALPFIPAPVARPFIVGGVDNRTYVRLGWVSHERRPGLRGPAGAPRPPSPRDDGGGVRARRGGAGSNRDRGARRRARRRLPARDDRHARGPAELRAERARGAAPRGGDAARAGGDRGGRSLPARARGGGGAARPAPERARHGVGDVDAAGRARAPRQRAAGRARRGSLGRAALRRLDPARDGDRAGALERAVRTSRRAGGIRSARDRPQAQTRRPGGRRARTLRRVRRSSTARRRARLRRRRRAAGGYAPPRGVMRSAVLMLAIVLLEVDAVGEVVLFAVQLPVFGLREVAVVAAQVAVALRLDAVGRVVEPVVLAVRERTVAHALVDARVFVMDPVLDFSRAGRQWGDHRGEKRGGDDCFGEHQVVSPKRGCRSMSAMRMRAALSSYAHHADRRARSQRTLTALSGASHVHILSGRGTIETPAASASAAASTASARAALA